MKVFRTNLFALYICLALMVSPIFAARAARAANAGARADSRQLTKNEALKLQDEFQHAVVAADGATLGKLMADDCVFIHGNGMMQDKAVFTSMLTSGRMKVTEFRSTSPQVTLFNGGAIVSSVADWGMAPPRGPQGANPMVLHMRISQIWIHTAAGWQMILEQDTMLQQPKGMRPAGTASHP